MKPIRVRRWRFSWAWTIGAVLVLSGGCVHRPPNNPPPPADRDRDGVPDATDQCPDESGPAENQGCPVPPELPPPCVLRTDGVKLVCADGRPFVPFGASQCCMTPTSVPAVAGKKKILRRPAPIKIKGEYCNSLWPMAAECWQDYAHSFGANMFHFRMGPFYASPDLGEDDFAEIGGPYLGGPGSDWNPKFWETYRRLLSHSRKIGSGLEIVVADTWVCKHTQWGDLEMPWPDEDVQACGRRPSPEQERFIRKVVSEAKDSPHVIWITDNEGGEIQGTKREWYEWVHSVIRDEEVRSGGAVRLIGTNNTDFCDGPFDYCATHARAALLAPIAGKHTENNERNPQFSPEQEHSNFCEAQKRGLHYWFWRAEMSDADFEQTLKLFGQGCGGPIACFVSDSEDPAWTYVCDVSGRDGAATCRSSQTLGWLNEAKAKVPFVAGRDFYETNRLLGEELRKAGHCATAPWRDAVAILAPDGLTEEHHATASNDLGGGYTQQPFKSGWRHPTPPIGGGYTQQCGVPQPPALSKWNVKIHTIGPSWTTLDSTPLVGPDAAYCAEIGFTDGRAFCSVRQEGAADRVACEAKLVGTPQWSGPGEVIPTNPYLYRVARGTSGTAKVCASVAPSVCGSVEVTP